MILYFPKFQKPDSEDPSNDWIKSFNERNGTKKVVSTDLERNRVEMGTSGNVTSWFENSYDKVDLSKYDPKMIGNADESMLTTKSRLMCIVKKDERYAVIKDDQNTEHITILSLVCTNGDYMPPMMVFKLKTLPTNLDELVKLGKFIWASQENGWIDIDNFKNWVKEVIKWIKLRRLIHGLPNDSKFLLFLDGHSSREHSESLKLFSENHIDVMLFPSHCSHLLQPLDVGVFGPFKKYLKVWKRKFYGTTIKWIGEGSVSNHSEQRVKLILAAINALHQAMAFTHVERGFRLTGIWPRDKNQTLKNPRIIEKDEITMKNSKRRILPTTGGLITEENIIRLVEENENNPTKKKKTSKYTNITYFLGNQKRKNQKVEQFYNLL